MPLSGVISRQPPIQMSEWLSFISRHDYLVRPAPRQIVNPFTRIPDLHIPEPGYVQIWRDGRTVGGLGPSQTFEDDAELDVFAPAGQPNAEVREVASTIAAELGATLEWLPEE